MTNLVFTQLAVKKFEDLKVHKRKQLMHIFDQLSRDPATSLMYLEPMPNMTNPSIRYYRKSKAGLHIIFAVQPGNFIGVTELIVVDILDDKEMKRFKR